MSDRSGATTTSSGGKSNDFLKLDAVVGRLPKSSGCAARARAGTSSRDTTMASATVREQRIVVSIQYNGPAVPFRKRLPVVRVCAADEGVADGRRHYGLRSANRAPDDLVQLE